MDPQQVDLSIQYPAGSNDVSLSGVNPMAVDVDKKQVTSLMNQKFQLKTPTQQRLKTGQYKDFGTTITDIVSTEDLLWMFSETVKDMVEKYLEHLENKNQSLTPSTPKWNELEKEKKDILAKYQLALTLYDEARSYVKENSTGADATVNPYATLNLKSDIKRKLAKEFNPSNYGNLKKGGQCNTNSKVCLAHASGLFQFLVELTRFIFGGGFSQPANPVYRLGPDMRNLIQRKASQNIAKYDKMVLQAKQKVNQYLADLARRVEELIKTFTTEGGTSGYITGAPNWGKRAYAYMVLLSGDMKQSGNRTAKIAAGIVSSIFTAFYNGAGYVVRGIGQGLTQFTSFMKSISPTFESLQKSIYPKDAAPSKLAPMFNVLGLLFFFMGGLSIPELKGKDLTFTNFSEYIKNPFTFNCVQFYISTGIFGTDERKKLQRLIDIQKFFDKYRPKAKQVAMGTGMVLASPFIAVAYGFYVLWCIHIQQFLRW